MKRLTSVALSLVTVLSLVSTPCLYVKASTANSGEFFIEYGKKPRVNYYSDEDVTYYEPYYVVQIDEAVSEDVVEVSSDEDVVVEPVIPSGPKLTKSGGVFYNDAGFKETYYNLNMSTVVYYMHQLGYDYEYWVRSDGVKMFGPYVMIAADLTLYSKGDLIETSLGTGMVCDTGTAIKGYVLDIAVNW